MRDVVSPNLGVAQLLAHRIQFVWLDGPHRELALVRHRVLKLADHVEHVDAGAKRPWLFGAALLQSERMADPDRAYNRRVRQLLLTRHALYTGE